MEVLLKHRAALTILPDTLEISTYCKSISSTCIGGRSTGGCRARPPGIEGEPGQTLQPTLGGSTAENSDTKADRLGGGRCAEENARLEREGLGLQKGVLAVLISRIRTQKFHLLRRKEGGRLPIRGPDPQAQRSSLEAPTRRGSAFPLGHGSATRAARASVKTRTGNEEKPQRRKRWRNWARKEEHSPVRCLQDPQGHSFSSRSLSVGSREEGQWVTGVRGRKGLSGLLIPSGGLSLHNHRADTMFCSVLGTLMPTTPDRTH